LQTVVETPAFIHDAKTLGMAEAERLAMVTWVASNPGAGDVIEGTGGAGKLRFGGKGKGKSGGFRVITFYSGPDFPVFLFNVFAKNEKTDLTPKERQALKTVLTNIADVYKGKRKSR
jgi:hypothetical protein